MNHASAVRAARKPKRSGSYARLVDAADLQSRPHAAIIESRCKMRNKWALSHFSGAIVATSFSRIVSATLAFRRKVRPACMMRRAGFPLNSDRFRLLQ
jgi:hypothetical protein